MSKGSGGTKNSTWRTNQNNNPGAADEGVSAAQFEALVNSISNDKGEFDSRIWELLDNDQRELALMEAGFTGMISEDDFEMGNLYIPWDKKTMNNLVIEHFVNAAMGYDTNDETYHIGYKDGHIITADDIDLSDINPKVSWNTIEKKVISKLQMQKVDFILHYNASSQPMYWVSDKGKDHFKKYGGFEEWKKGRGEKRRNYIQDDWV